MITPEQPGDVTSWLGITTRLPSPFTDFTIAGIFRLSSLAAAARTFFYIGNDVHAASAPYIRVGTDAADGLTPKLTLYNGSTTWTDTAADPLLEDHNYAIFLIKTGTLHEVYIEDVDVTLTPTLACTLTHDTTATPTHLYTCVNSSTAVCNVKAYLKAMVPADVVTDLRSWLPAFTGTSRYLTSTFRVPTDLQDQTTGGANTAEVVPPDSSFEFSRHNWTSDGNPVEYAADPDHLVADPCPTFLSPFAQATYYDIPPGPLGGFGTYQVTHVMGGPMIDEAHIPVTAQIVQVTLYNAGTVDPDALVLGPCEATYGLSPTSTVLPGCITITDGVTTATLPNESFPYNNFFTHFFGCGYGYGPAVETDLATNPLTGVAWTTTDLYNDTWGFTLLWKNLGALPIAHVAAFRVADINLLVIYIGTAAGTGTIIVRKDVPANPFDPTFSFTTTDLTPSSFTLQGGQTQTFGSLAPGMSYAVFEAALDGWMNTGISVSNGSQASAISVSADEVVTVVFTNRQRPLEVTTELIRRERTGPHLTQERKRMQFPRVELHLETGLGANEGQGADPQVMMSYSDDGGHTWSREHWTSAGEIGQYLNRVYWTQLGQSRDRVFRVVVSDPVAWRLIALYLTVTPGTN